MTHSKPEQSNSDRLPFLMELSPNTHSLLLAVSLPPLPPPPHDPTGLIRIRDTIPDGHTSKDQGLLITPLEAVVHGHTYPFPHPIDPRSIHPTILPHPAPSSPSCSDLLLRATALAPSVSTPRPSLPLRAANYWPTGDLLLADFLAARTTQSIACVQCRATLIAQPFALVRTLPSSSWHDLVECWACHETNVVMPTSGHLHVDSPHTVWVGAAHLVVHKDALAPGAVHWDLGRAGETRGKCAQCAATLAIRPKHVPEAVHLVKPRVLACARGGLAWSVAKVRAAMVLAEVLDQVTLHAAHKVAITDLDDDDRASAGRRVVVEVWTINWNCQVRTRQVVARRAAKVLYRLPPSGEQPKEVKSVDDLPDGYGLVVVPDAHLVVDMLEHVNRDLPESQRQAEIKAGEPWRVSYLTA